MSFESKRILVTGASSGIGAACAKQLAARGARLLLTGRSMERLQRTAAECGVAETHLEAADLTRREDLDRLAAIATAKLGGLDILLLAAGVGLYAPATKADPALTRQVFDVNFFAPAELIRLLAPSIPAGGSIVAVSSIAGMLPLPWHPAYSASKFALNSYCDSLRMELAGTGRQVLCVCPGLVETPFRENTLGGRAPEDVMRQPGFRITAEQCADAILAGLRARKQTVVTPWLGWLAVWAHRFLPWLVQARMARMRQS